MKTRKLFVLFHGRFPSEKAASIFVAENCVSFSDAGLEVVLVVPRRKNKIKENPYEYYRVPNNFSIKYVFTLDFFSSFLPGKLSFYLSTFTFSISTLFYLFFNAKKDDVIYSNEIIPLLATSFFYKNTFYEMHDFPESSFGIFKFFINRMKWVLIHNKWKRDEAIKRFNLDERKILHQPNVVKTEMFDIDVTKEKAREELGLEHEHIIVYTGHLYGWKGVDTLALAAREIKPATVIFVGGTEFDVNRLKEKYSDIENIVFVGHKKHHEIAVWQKAADVLVLPNTAKEKISKYYTSPMKLFEYMASKRPIVASDIPSIREVVDDTMVHFVAPDDHFELAIGLKRAIDNVAEDKIMSAYEHVKKQTWTARAGRIVEFIRLDV